MNSTDLFSCMEASSTPLIIAEIGNNHEGDLVLAEKMIDAAHEAGAHAVKFQTFRTEEFISNANPERFERMKSFELSFDEFRHLKAKAEALKMIFLSTPFDLESAEFLCSLCNDIKISSGDNTFWPLLDKVSQYDVNLIISCGLVTYDEIDGIFRYVQDRKKVHQTTGKIALLHCVAEYPVASDTANLNVIPEMIARFDAIIGYSDHTIGNQASIIAAILGAQIIEKHFTIDQNYSDFRDHQISSDPHELKDLVQNVSQIDKLMGSGRKQRTKGETEQYKLYRRSLIAKIDMPSGTMITLDKISWVRPSGSISPGEENLILGKSLIKDVNAGDRLTDEIVN